MPAFKNYSCESSESSCSLLSVTGISSNSETTCDYSISNSSSCTEETKTCSEATYSDKTSCESKEVFTPCKDPALKDKCLSLSSNQCSKLVKKYNCSKEELLAISDIIIVLNFIKNKLIAVQPNVVARDTSKYLVNENIAWLECFVDTLFCVLRKNEAYKIIKVRECKLLNDVELGVSDRTYIIEIKYHTKCGEVCNKLPLTFKWSQLTNNTSKSYNAVLNATVSSDIDNEIKAYQAKSTVPFLC
jgi:hypothetical protein